MEEYRKNRRPEISPDGKRLSKVAPDDWLLQAFGDELLEKLGEDCPVTHVDIMKLRKALREQPERILTVIRDSVIPFIQGLPDIDWSIVGAEVVGEQVVCNRCLTSREKARIPKGDRMTRDDADEYGFTCSRCGKPL
jgi:hypothetical protein